MKEIDKERRQPPDMNISFPDKNKVQPEGFKNLSIGDTVVFRGEGKLVRIEDSAEEWSPGKRIKMEIKSFKIEDTDESTSMDDAVKASASTV